MNRIHSTTPSNFSSKGVVVLAALALLFSLSAASAMTSTPFTAEDPVSLAEPTRASLKSDNGADSLEARALEKFGELPLYFEANKGQTHESVRFLTRGPGYVLFLTPREAVFSLRGSPQSPGGNRILRMEFVEASQNALVEGENPLQGKVNYLRGSHPEKWHTDVPLYEKVRYRQVYPGIDAVFYDRHGRLEYDFVVAPGRDPSSIELAFQGASRMEISRGGDLLLHTPAGIVRQHKPFVYQESQAGKQEVKSGYLLRGANRIAFQLGSYDRARPLIIDPVIEYSTYVGGSGRERGYDIDVDSQGYAYVTGETTSPDFPEANPNGFGGSEDAFVFKLNQDGSSLEYATYFGGSAIDKGRGIAVYSDGSVFVVGETSSSDIPTVPDAGESDPHMSSTEGFILRLSSPGNALVFSHYFGGNGEDLFYDVELDPQGYAYAVGTSASDNLPSPTSTDPVYQNSRIGSNDVVVARYNSTGDLDRYTYLGGPGDDQGKGIALDDGSGPQVYIAGQTLSDLFPSQPGGISVPQSTSPIGGTDAFAARFDSLLSSLTYNTRIGGDKADTGESIDVDAFGNAYLTGDTASANVATDGTNITGTAADAFVAKINPAGGQVFFTYLGGSLVDGGNDIAVNRSNGKFFVTGLTASNDFPAMDPLPGHGSLQGASDAFIARYTSAGVKEYAGFLGGIGSEEGYGVAVDLEGAAYVTGDTSSPLDFPVSDNAYQDQKVPGLNTDAFVTKIVDEPGQKSLELFPPNSTIEEGEEITITIEGGESPYEVASDNESVVIVVGWDNDNGTVTAQGVGEGEAKVTATDSMGSEGSAMVTVMGDDGPPEPGDLIIGFTSLTLEVGERREVSVQGGMPPYSASSDNESVAGVEVGEDSMTVEGMGPGSTRIVVKDSDDEEAMLQVTVTGGDGDTSPPVEISPESVVLDVGGTVRVTVSGGMPPYTAQPADESIAGASVDNDNGTSIMVEGRSPGRTTVLVEDSDNGTATLDVTVGDSSEPDFPIVGGCEEGPEVAEPVSTTEGFMELRLCMEPPETLSGSSFIGVEAPQIFPGLTFFRPSDEKAEETGSYIELVKMPEGYLPGTEDYYFEKGELSSSAGSQSLDLGTSGLRGLIIFVTSYYLPEGQPLTEENLKTIQSINMTFE